MPDDRIANGDPELHRRRLMWKLSSDDPMPDMTRFGGWILYHRVVGEIPIEQILASTGISESRLRALENGTWLMDSIDSVIRLADALGLRRLDAVERAYAEHNKRRNGPSGR